MGAIEAWPQVLATDALKEKVAQAKVLCVGAGGIGCELLKTLVMSGFQNIEAIDMDTIETSNLNRQFLFRKRHVGESKAKVAAAAVQQMNPKAHIVAHQANVKEPRFDVDYFKGFALVLNGLDNLDARRHVNRMCLAAGVPLVESGTAGYLGQVTVHVKDATECFECQPKPAPKTYPICTIRNTPDKPIHCVVWAKELLFARLFGQQETSDLDGSAEQDAGAHSGQRSSDAAATPEDPAVFLRREGEAAEAYASRIFDHVFGHDVQRLLSIEDLWKTRSKPTPLFLSSLMPTSDSDKVNGSAKGAATEMQATNCASTAASSSACKSLGLRDAHIVWSAADNARVFVEAASLFLETRGDEVGSAVFDKDDELAVEFVTAAANLRALCYGIPTQSLFDTKGMAGNIIHAIATTNAIVGGLIVLEALKLLAGQLAMARSTFVYQHLSEKRLLFPCQPSPPNPGCMVCGTAQVHLAADTNSMTLQQFIDKVLKGKLAMNEPTISCNNFYYEEGEGLEADEVADNARNLPKPLAELPGGGINHGAMVSVSDQTQDFNVTLIVSHADALDEEEHPERFILSGNVLTPQAGHVPAVGASSSVPKAVGPPESTYAADDECIITCIDDGTTAVAAAAAVADPKGKRPASSAGEQGRSKRARLEHNNCIVIE